MEKQLLRLLLFISYTNIEQFLIFLHWFIRWLIIFQEKKILFHEKRAFMPSKNKEINLTFPSKSAQIAAANCSAARK